MEKILLIMMLTQPVEISKTDKEKVDQLKGLTNPVPIDRREFIRVCSKNEKSEDCKHLTQSELSSGAVRGIKIDVDNQQP
jgi:hypothetical protein